MTKRSKWIQYVLALFLFLSGIIYILCNTTDNPRYDLILEKRTMLIQAIFTTLWISVVTLLLSIVFGFFFFLMLRSKFHFVKAIAVIFKELIMGTPLLVMIFLVVYVLGPNIMVSNKLILGIVALTLYTCPYVANSYESAIKIIDEDQYVVMNLYHFSGFQKYSYVILPQMIKPFLPSLINLLSSAIKSSALLKIVSVTEISYIITVISAKNWAVVEGYLVMWLCYLLITIPLSIIAQYIGKRYDH